MESKPSLADDYALLSHEGYVSEMKYLLNQLAISTIARGNIQTFVNHLKTILCNLVDQTFMLSSPPPNKNIRRKIITNGVSNSHLSYSISPVRKFRHIKHSPSVPASILEKHLNLQNIDTTDNLPVIKGPATFAKQTRGHNQTSQSSPGPGSYNPKTHLTNAHSPQFVFNSSKKTDIKNRDSLPGPGSYQPRSYFLSKYP